MLSKLFVVNDHFLSEEEISSLRQRAQKLWMKTSFRLLILSLLIFSAFTYAFFHLAMNHQVDIQRRGLNEIHDRFNYDLETLQLGVEEEANKFAAFTFNGLDHRQRVFSLSGLVGKHANIITYLDAYTEQADNYMRIDNSRKFRYSLSFSETGYSFLLNQYNNGYRGNISGFLGQPNSEQGVSFYIAAPVIFDGELIAVVIAQFDDSLLKNTVDQALFPGMRLFFQNGVEILGNETLLLFQSNTWRQMVSEFIEHGNGIKELPSDTITFLTVGTNKQLDTEHIPLTFTLVNTVSVKAVISQNVSSIALSFVGLLLMLIISVVVALMYAEMKFKAWVIERDSSVRALAFDCCEGLIIRDRFGSIVNVNQGLVNLMGYSKSQLIGISFSLLDSQQTTPTCANAIMEQAKVQGLWKGEVVCYKANGEPIVQLLTVGVSYDENKNLAYIVENYSDLTLIKQQETELRIAAVAFDTQNSLVITNTEGEILRVNKAFMSMTGYAEQEVVGKKPNILASGRHDQKFYSQMWQSLLSEGFWRGAVWNKRKDGTEYLELKVISAVKDVNGMTTHYVSNGLDYTVQNELELQLEKLSKTDPLTGSFNRRTFEERLREALLVFKRYEQPFGILLLDLDHFKAVNDNYGHDIGDQVLVRISKLIQDNIRETDMLFRWGGEEFVVLLPNTEKRGVEIFGNRIRELIEQEETHPRITCSIGATIADRYDEKLSIIKRADEALYQAKSTRNSFVLLARDEQCVSE